MLEFLGGMIVGAIISSACIALLAFPWPKDLPNY